MSTFLQPLTEARAVVFLALLAGGALTLVEVTLGPRIAENIRRQTFDQIPALVEGSVPEATVALPLDPDVPGRDWVYAALDDGGEVRGWVVSGMEAGYSGPIALLVGTNPAADRITGIFVLQQTETPGLGAKITRSEFRSRFEDLAANRPVEVVKSDPAGNQVLAITGATISSQAVADGVNRSMNRLRAALTGGGLISRLEAALLQSGDDV